MAVKVLPEHLAEDPEALARFEREAKAVAALSHPNILAIHDVGREGGDVLRRDGAARGRDAARARSRPGALPLRKARRLRGADRPGPRGRPRARHRPPRPQAREPVRDAATAASRSSTSAWRGTTRPPARGADDTHSPTLARATDARARCSAPSATCRPSRCAARRPTRARDIFSFGAVLLRDADGAARLPARHRRGDDDGDPQGGAGRPRERHRHDGDRPAARARPHRRALPREEPGGALPVGARPRASRSRPPRRRRAARPFRSPRASAESGGGACSRSRGSPRAGSSERWR